MVKPPHNPIMRNWVAKIREEGGTGPSGFVKAAKTPMTKEPITLIARMPQGKVSPNCLEMRMDSQKRSMLPKAPPKPTQKYASMSNPTKSGPGRQSTIAMALSFNQTNGMPGNAQTLRLENLLHQAVKSPFKPVAQFFGGQPKDQSKQAKNGRRSGSFGLAQTEAQREFRQLQ